MVAVLLKHFESHSAVAAAASASKGIAEESCVLFLGLFGILVQPVVSPAGVCWRLRVLHGICEHTVLCVSAVLSDVMDTAWSCSMSVCFLC